jgi:mono/diheme cytochrome c family protein
MRYQNGVKVVSVLLSLVLLIGSCTSARAQEVRGVLQEINAGAEISLLTPEGELVVAQGDSGTSYVNNGEACSASDLPPGSLVSVKIENDRAVSVVEYEDSDEDSDEDESGESSEPTTITDGAQLYSMYCSRCHNSNPPNIWRTNRTATQLTNAINSGPGSMPSYSGILSVAQVDAIVGFIRGTPSTTTSLPTTTSSTPVVDATLIYINNCAGCHGVDRTGGRGPDITQPQLSNRSVSNLINFISGHNTGRNLSSGDVSGLAGWLKGVTTTSTTTTSTTTTTSPLAAHQNLNWQGPTTCLACHESQARDMFGAVHYQWKGQTPFIVDGPDIQGKDAGAFNAFCINILGNWKGCGTCHPGLGARPETTLTQSQLANIDCLICHQKDYKRTIIGDTFVPDTANMTISIDQAVRTVHLPERTNCVFCHARSGGGDAFKRGDLTLAHASTTDVNFDIHMSTTGVDLQCVDCHNWENHHVPGRGADLRPSDLQTVPQCTDCHAGKATANGHSTPEVNRHVSKLACQTCHIPAYGKDAADTTANEATETHRTWVQSHFDGVRYEPIITLGNNIIPVYRFWDKTSSAYNMNDTAVVSPDTGNYAISRPNGSINDPDSKLYPFKYKTAEQPLTTASQKLIALDTSVFFATGDAQQAISAGLSNMGMSPAEPSSWVTTDEFLMLNHEVSPAGSALTCNQCHGTTTQINLSALGYVLKGPQSAVCSQCHEQENYAGFTSNHNKHRSEGVDCSSCHNFTRRQVTPTTTGTTTTTTAPPATTTSQTTAIAQVYANQCAGCHGANRQGGQGPALTTTALANLTLSQVQNRVNHSGRLTSALVPLMAEYLKNVSP